MRAPDVSVIIATYNRSAVLRHVLEVLRLQTFGNWEALVVGDACTDDVVVPPGVWHGLIATGIVPALVLNLPDRAYAYEEPDHWRLPPDSPQIPYRFERFSEALP